MKEQFEAIKKAYLEQDREGMKKGKLPMRSTDVGFWGCSNMDDVYAWFEKMRFPPETRFIDLGCGDGRVVLIASLFVQAQGVEYDEELARRGHELKESLGLDCHIYHGKIEDINLANYDALYMYADRMFAYLEPKLKEELTGTLNLYHDTYHPEGLEKGKITWIGQIPIFSYTQKT